jgi:hypothetical protein
MKQESFKILNVHAAELAKITLSNGEDLSVGAIFHFHLPEIGRDIDHVVTASANEDDCHSLKAIARYLECPVKSVKGFDHRRLIGRRCCLAIRRVKRGKTSELQIVRFMFDLTDTLRLAEGRAFFPVDGNTDFGSLPERNMP